MKILKNIIFSFFILSQFSSLVFAQETNGSPTFSMYHIDTGSATKTFTIAHGNNTEMETLIIENTDDSRSITIEMEVTGLSKEDLESLPKEWVSIDTNILELNPGEQKEVSFSISVPENTPLNTYVGMIRSKLIGYDNMPDTGDGVAVSAAVGIALKVEVTDKELVEAVEEPLEEMSEEIVSDTKTSDAEKKYKDKYDYYDKGKVTKSTRIVKAVQDNIELILLLLVLLVLIRVVILGNEVNKLKSPSKKMPPKKKPPRAKNKK